MKIALTIPTVGAGRWCWQGWANAFEFFGHEVHNLNLFPDTVVDKDTDLVICTTSQPRDDIREWRKNNPSKKLALNVLAWTDEDLPLINNAGVQASEGNRDYAWELRPDLVFAQYSPKWRERLLKKWEDLGFRLGSMEMAADAVVYPFETDEPAFNPDVFYVGGRWAYKAQNLDVWLMPVLNRFVNKVIVGRGWPFLTQNMDERAVGMHLHNAKVVPNMHEPHSTIGGYDVVERVFKTLYCGGLCITDSVAEMFDGFGFENEVHLLAAQSPDEYMEFITHAVENFNTPHFNMMRGHGQEFVALNHTYFNRVANLLFDLEIQPEYDEAVIKLTNWHKTMGLI